MKLLASWLTKALILLLVTYFLPGFTVNSILTALLVVAILAVLNVVIKPILLFLTLPINMLTLGLFTFVVNAFLLYLSSLVVKGFSIDSFLTAILAALIIAIISSVVSLAFKL